MPHEDHEKNRQAWNEIVEIHANHPFYRVKEFLGGETTLKAIELEELGDVSGKRLLHLMCRFGLDTLSWVREGALVTGIDISDRSIEYAEQLKKGAGLEAAFVRSDIMDLIGKIDQRFDIVFQSYGTHAWISDLDQWAAVVAHYLKPGGIFYIVDLHPFSTPIEDDSVAYFNPGPYRYTDAVDYADKDYTIKSEMVEWQHTLSGIINALINAGLSLEMLNEFDKCCYPKEKDWFEKDGFYYPPGGPPNYPLMFSLKARLGG
ncbi:MAG: class I SAM-dependent methyltransferase [candidate division Zixibacteria bacterium]|nr:class I SAM-dependent methyltransferase [candidate division Zixibacteria bacterium]